MLHRRAFLAALPVLGAARSAWSLSPEDFSVSGRYLPMVRDALAVPDPSLGAIMLAFTGDERSVFERIPSPSADLSTPALDGARAEDAIEAIVRAARGRRVVILNEAHHVSRDRAFALALALRLRRDGFSWFAAESLSEKIRPGERGAFVAPSPVRLQPAPPGAPITDETTGYPDPVYAELLRGVSAAGYRTFAYEQRRDQRAVDPRADARAREQAEAENLAWLLKREPHARVFVYCGYGHACKVPMLQGAMRTAMAARLRDLTGLEPLSIEQSYGAPAPERGLEDPALTPVLDRLRPRRPVSVTLADGSPLILNEVFRGGFDIGVVHPRLAYVHGRPGWLAAAPGRRLARLALPSPAPAGSLAQAVPAAELARSPAAIPSDQYPIAAGAREATFFLSKGAYAVRVETPDGFIHAGPLRVA